MSPWASRNESAAHLELLSAVRSRTATVSAQNGIARDPLSAAIPEYGTGRIKTGNRLLGRFNASPGCYRVNCLSKR
jgi:hypothetical protein